MTDPIHEELYKGYTIQVFYDDSPISPREWDNLGTMYCRHSKYNLGDKRILTSFYNNNGDYADIDSEESFKDWIKQTEGDIAVILPLFLYDHSGITIYTTGDTRYRQHEAWDSGQVGWIVVTKDKLKKEYTVKRITKAILKQAETVLRGEIKIYDQFLRDEVYGYNVLDPEGKETAMSVWGFYGDYKHDLMDDAKSNIDYDIEQKAKRKQEKLKAYITHHVPLEKRTFTVL